MKNTTKRLIPQELDESAGRVRLPTAPETASPVPWLTSLHAREGRGDYGDAGYRGNCSGLLIEDLLSFYCPKSVLDPMAGSGTCRDVCSALGIACHSHDLHDGFDATQATQFRLLPKVDFVWMHPPYYTMVSYGTNSHCLSRSNSIAEFLSRLEAVLLNCLSVLAADGVIALLMGDGKQQGIYWGLPFRMLQAAERVGLWLAAPEIIRFGHGSTSSKKRYTTAFIPRVHDVCLVLKRKTDLLRNVTDKKGLDLLTTPSHRVQTSPAEIQRNGRKSRQQSDVYKSSMFYCDLIQLSVLIELPLQTFFRT